MGRCSARHLDPPAGGHHLVGGDHLVGRRPGWADVLVLVTAAAAVVAGLEHHAAPNVARASLGVAVQLCSRGSVRCDFGPCGLRLREPTRNLGPAPADTFLSLIHISEPTRRTPISYAV